MLAIYEIVQFLCEIEIQIGKSAFAVRALDRIQQHQYPNRVCQSSDTNVPAAKLYSERCLLVRL